MPTHRPGGVHILREGFLHCLAEHTRKALLQVLFHGYRGQDRARAERVDDGKAVAQLWITAEHAEQRQQREIGGLVLCQTAHDVEQWLLGIQPIEFNQMHIAFVAAALSRLCQNIAFLNGSPAIS